MFRESALALIRHHHVELAALKVKALGIYGSVARGDDTPDSDVDLIVEFDGEGGWKDQFEVQRFLEGLLGRSVDLHRADQILPRFKPYIKRELIGIRGFLMPKIPGDNPDGSFKYPPPPADSKRDPMIYAESIHYACGELIEMFGMMACEEFIANEINNTAASYNIIRIGRWIRKLPQSHRGADPVIDWEEIVKAADQLECAPREPDIARIWHIVNDQIPRIYGQMQEIISVPIGSPK